MSEAGHHGFWPAPESSQRRTRATRRKPASKPCAASDSTPSSRTEMNNARGRREPTLLLAEPLTCRAREQSNLSSCPCPVLSCPVLSCPVLLGLGYLSVPTRISAASPASGPSALHPFALHQAGLRLCAVGQGGTSLRSACAARGVVLAGRWRGQCAQIETHLDSHRQTETRQVNKQTRRASPPFPPLHLPHRDPSFPRDPLLPAPIFPGGVKPHRG